MIYMPRHGSSLYHCQTISQKYLNNQIKVLPEQFLVLWGLTQALAQERDKKAALSLKGREDGQDGTIHLELNIPGACFCIIHCTSLPSIMEDLSRGFVLGIIHLHL